MSVQALDQQASLANPYLVVGQLPDQSSPCNTTELGRLDVSPHPSGLLSAGDNGMKRSESAGTETLTLSPPHLTVIPPNEMNQIQRRASYDPNITPPRKPRIKRGKTVDTSTINKEVFEDYAIYNQYEVVDIIGHGSYGIVHKATDRQNGQTYAMKIVGKKKLIKKNFQFRRPRGGPPPDPLAGIRAEIAILKKLDHPNVVKLVEVLEDTNEDDLILVFEYIKNGAIMGEITVENKFTETECQQHFIDLILGLEYLHSRKIVHRDIKPENLLLDNTNTLKIADFGVSEEWTDNDAMLKKSAGTPAFLAPETLNGTSFGGKAIDIWAAGVTLYCMIYGRVPFKGRTITDLHEKILTREVKFPEDIPISHDLKDLLTQLLDKNPETRIKIPQIRSHPWFVNTTRQIPSQEENCQGDTDVTDEDIKEALQEFQTPIHILVMIKNMAKKKSLRNPFVPGIDASLSPASSPRINDNRSNKHKLFSNKTIPHISISADDDNEDITNT